ncbi:MAG TPA: serine hydroxymethyltransferase [Thermodesulfobacteriota bacterium]|nr:serine hydroxymethyltransferase [Thermodesulfobacteriota bacterium]
MGKSKASLKRVDPEVAQALQRELKRQTEKLELIASENFVSRAVLEAQASVLTNKYAEGYPGKRYYGGCEYVDRVETLAIERVCRIFKAEYANVQPHSGSQANMAVLFGALKPGDAILSMDLSHGGHLTHGSPVSFSGNFFKIHAYGVNRETQQIDYGEVDALADQYRPKLIIAGASAYPRTFDFAAFAQIARKVGAFLMVDMAHIAGLIAAEVHPSPIPHADFITSTTHKTLRGPRGGLILSKGQHGKLLNAQIFPGIQGGPMMHTIAAKAVAFKEALTPAFKSYQEQVVLNARTLANELMRLGFKLISNGTDNHMMLMDVGSSGLTGVEAEKALDSAGITVNKNSIPFETKGPKITSGIRIGTPAVTTRGMKAPEMVLIAEFIARVLSQIGNESLHKKIRREVREFCRVYPLFPEIV